MLKRLMKAFMKGSVSWAPIFNEAFNLYRDKFVSNNLVFLH